MEADTFHFQGKTIVSRGEWKMTVPVDFHLTLDECADPFFVDQASVFLAELFTKEYVNKHDKEYRDAMMEEDVYDD